MRIEYVCALLSNFMFRLNLVDEETAELGEIGYAHNRFMMLIRERRKVRNDEFMHMVIGR